jgi:alkylhydroperoxidase family enzyme
MPIPNRVRWAHCTPPPFPRRGTPKVEPELLGEAEQRIYALNAWWEAPFFTERERAAPALTEAVTLVHDGHVPDEVYAEAAEVFNEAQLAALIWAEQ